ncbi:MAG: flagellar biosynthetic protein FliO [Colwellia sp.]|nr:flagellar biosynthetic protein FliO [Colwellia sp.]
MSKYFYFLAVFLLVFITTVSYAQQELGTSENAKQTVGSIVAEPLLVKQAPEVGKHVMENTDAGSMILSLLMVLAVIVITALVLKRFNVTQQNSGQLKVVASLSLGVKERLIVAQVGEQQLVLGVTPQQITLIKSLEEPIASSQAEKTSALTGTVLAFLQKNNFKPKNK